MRTVKQHDVRKSEILDCAQRLFYTVGYDQTTVAMIIDATGIAKGTFYHYFKSKEEMLDGVIERYTTLTMQTLEPILALEAPAHEKLGRFHDAAGALKAQNAPLLVELARVIYRPENFLLLHKFTERTLAAEGSFDTPDAEETAEMLVRVWVALGESMAPLLREMESRPQNIDVIQKRLEAFDETAERILGAPRGSLHFGEAGRRALGAFRRELAARAKTIVGGRV